MKLFRSLALTTAAICSFSSLAGIITFDWNPASDSGSFDYHYSDSQSYGSVSKHQMLRTMQNVNYKIKLNQTLGANFFRNESTDHYGSTYQRIDFDSSHNAFATLENLQKMCSYTDFTAADCDTSSIYEQQPKISFQISKHLPNLYSPGQYGVRVSFINILVLENKHISDWDKVIINNRYYVSELMLDYYYTFSNAPNWLQKNIIPNREDLFKFLHQQSNDVRLEEYLAVNTQTIGASASSNFQSYYLSRSGSIQWQTEEVNSPTTISALLLGLTGLALRRRLGA